MTALKKLKEASKKPSPKYCVQSECNQAASTHGYCRLHYLANWKHIKFNKHVQAERRLNNFVDRLSKKYPESFMEKIKEGLESEDKFAETAVELDIEPKEAAKETDDEFLEKFLRVVKPGQ